MDLAKLCAIFDGSIFPDEYRGDFNSALQRINDLETLDMGSDGEHKAEITLLKATLDLMKGNLAKAESYLLELTGRAEANLIAPSWYWRISALRSHKTSLQRAPPALSFRHELGSIAAMTWDEQWKVLDCHSESRRFFETRQDLVSTPSDLYMYRLILSTWGFFKALATFAVVWHQEFPKGEYHTVAGTYDPAPIDKYCALLNRIGSEAADHGVSCVLSQLRRFCIEASLVDPRLDSSLRDLEMHGLQLSQQNDHVGLAWFKMRSADSMLSPPFTNPVALNLIAVDNSDAGFLSQTWDSTEDRLSLRMTTATRQLYDEARVLFIRGGSSRGHAAVRLRIACIEYAEIMDSVSTLGEHKQTLSRICQDLDAVTRLFGIDECNVQIVKVHQILVKLLQRKWSTVQQIAADIGTWGIQVDNPIVSHFSGLLLLRAGRRRLLRAGDVDFAMRCFQCASTIFNKMGDPLAELKGIVAQCQVHSNTMNDVALLELIGPVREKLAAAFTIFDDVIKTCQGTRTRTTLLMAKQNLLVTLAPLLSRAYSRSGDKAAAESWRKELDRLEDDESMYDAVQTALSSEYNRNAYLGQWGTQLPPSLIEKARTDERMVGEVRAMLTVYHQKLEVFDIDEANAELECFISDTMKKYSDSSYVVLACAYLYNLMGRRDDIKSMLSRLPDSQPSSDVRCFVEYENTIAVRVMAQDWQRARSYLDAVIASNPTFLDPGVHQGDETWNRFLWAGLIAERTDSQLVALDRLRAARSKLENRRKQTSDDDAKIGSLATANASEVHQALGRVCLVTSTRGIPMPEMASEFPHLSAPPASWSEAAVEYVEDGRARALHDRFQEDGLEDRTSERDPLNAYPNRLRRHLKSIPESSRTEGEKRELADLEALLSANVDSSVQGSHHRAPKLSRSSSLTPAIKGLYQYIRPDEAVLSISLGSSSCTVMVITNKGVETVSTLSVQGVDVQTPACQLMKLLSDTKQSPVDDKYDLVRELAETVSGFIIKPVAEYIQLKSHITFVASTPFNAFPFSVLRLEGTALAERVSTSSCPSLRVLHHLLRQRTDVVHLPRVSVIVKPGNLKGTADFEEEPPLPLAGIEGIAIARLFQTWPQDAADMTRHDFRGALKKADILHLSTHGYIHADAPLLSYVSLRERFRVLEMIFSETEVKLCVFAACVTGLGKTSASNDVQGFSHAILSSGCRAFVGMLWKVNDVAAMFLMLFFYRRLAERGPGVSLASLLREAQVELKTLTTHAAHQVLDELIDVWDEAENAGLQPGHLVRKGRTLLKLKRRIGLLKLDFSDPSHWSAVSIFGDSHLT